MNHPNPFHIDLCVVLRQYPVGIGPFAEVVERAANLLGLHARRVREAWEVGIWLVRFLGLAARNGAVRICFGHGDSSKVRVAMFVAGREHSLPRLSRYRYRV